ncbi:unnamed protein product [Arabis nemorensis]|uniref:Essential protein Yae1 N-terminal domain-containing protein n=1 Tax=Arabis nemorensis TaxID=586526 RepID=A0A565BP77_9BRAS|nr:unnamed protein product [Arabis nemorensis]
MDPPQEVKLNLASELYGQSLHLSKPGNDDQAPEDLDEYFYGDPDDQEPSDARLLDREWECRQKKYNESGYRDGIIAGKEAASQEGYNIGYKESVLDGYKFGIVRGVSSALAFLPDDLREKLSDEQETRDKFQELHNSVYALSTKDAMKLFYETLTSNQGEEKSGEEEPRSGSDLGSYVTELSSLLVKSPKIEVKLDK